MITRRLFAAGLFAAPAIVRAASLMPIKAAPSFIWCNGVKIIFDHITNIAEVRSLNEDGPIKAHWAIDMGHPAGDWTWVKAKLP